MGGLDLIQITNRLDVATAAERAGVTFVMVDLEHLGKSDRQQGRNTVISGHTIDDVRRVRAVLTATRLLVRVNPFNPATREEVDAVIGAGADALMLPMFRHPEAVAGFADAVDERVPIILLMETPQAFARLDAMLSVAPGVPAVLHVGLNDLSIAMGLESMFEPLAGGLIDHVAQVTRARGVAFGFGGLGRMGEGTIPARWILGEHVRLGSCLVFLSRTFAAGASRGDHFDADRFVADVAHLRQVEREHRAAPAAALAANREQLVARVWEIAGLQRPLRVSQP